jgi:hypothetical protein
MKITRNAFLLCALALPITAGIAGNTIVAFAQDADVSAKAPTVIYVLRHAEKLPGDETKDPNLTPTGYKRAGLIPTLFIAKNGTPRLLHPDFIFAADTSKHSNRPIETITPTARALNLPLNHDFQDKDTAEISKELLSGKYAGKVVVICWRHSEIPALAAALGVADAPAKWDPDVFDQIWEIQWVGGKAQLTTMPEELLPGDATK